MSKQALEFESSVDHLLAELDIVRLGLEHEVMRTRASRGRDEVFDQYSGLFISDAEIDRDIVPPATDSREAGDMALFADRIAELRRHVDDAAGRAATGGVVLDLPRIAHLFQLDEIEVRILLHALGPDIDQRFDRYYGYIQNDVSKRRPTVQLLTRLLIDPDGVRRAREYFNSSSRLLRDGLVYLNAGAGDAVSFMSRQVQVPSTVADALLGISRIDDDLRSVARLHRPEVPDWKGHYFDRHVDIVEFLADTTHPGSRWPAYVSGPRGAGKSELVSALALRINCDILEIEWDDLWRRHTEHGERLRLVRRDAMMNGCLVHVSRFAELRGDHRERSAQAGLLDRLLQTVDGCPVIVTAERPLVEIKQYCRRLRHDFELRYPDLDERRELWARVITLEPGVTDHAEQLASRFRFSPGQIRSAIEAAAVRAGRNAEGVTYIGIEDVYRSCRDESNHGLLAYARKLTPRHGWDDIVLPPDGLKQLKEICYSVEYRTRVLRDWGFENRLSLGRGLNVLFAGPSGTGKTMSAEIIARELGLDIYKLDISRVLSRYIGDSERALKRIFDEAHSANSILFIDEADSICGTRTELKSSHDKYANVEANFVLQKIEEHEGIVILATNFRKNLDSALTRRLNFIVEFPLPGEQERRRIWDLMIPAATPRSVDVDLDFLARRFKFTGGNIRNVALNAAFLAAASKSDEIAMEHLVLAAKREFQKLGKICSKSDFSHYYELVAEA